MPQGKGTYGSQVGRPSKKKKYQAGGSIDPFSEKNPEGIKVEKELEALELQGQNAMPTTNAQERSQTSPMGAEVGTGVYKKGGAVKKLRLKDFKMGPGPEESPTLREAMLHKGGVKKSEKIEAGLKKYPETFEKYKSFKKKK